MMRIATKSQIKTSKKELLKVQKAIEALTIKDISSEEYAEHNFRDRDIKASDIVNLLFGKASFAQVDGIDTIVTQLVMDKCFSKGFSRGAIDYRFNQLEPKKFLDTLLGVIAPSPKKNEYIKCIYDGSSVSLPNCKDIENKYGKSITGIESLSHKPIAKLLYLMTEDNQTCINATFETYKYSERVGLISHAIEAKNKGFKLDVITDRGLYGAMPCSILNKLGHKFSLRLGGELIKRMKNEKFKKDSVIIKLHINKASIKPYEELIPGLKPGLAFFRIVRKKGNSKRKPMYIITNEYDSGADEIFCRYWKRQRIEDSFKYLKSYGGLEKIHFNTSLNLTELILASLIFYISIVQKILNGLIDTPRPDEKGKETANRHLAWRLFFAIIKSGYKTKIIGLFIQAILNKTLKIRPGRKHQRYEIIVLRRKIN